MCPPLHLPAPRILMGTEGGVLVVRPARHFLRPTTSLSRTLVRVPPPSRGLGGSSYRRPIYSDRLHPARVEDPVCFPFSPKPPTVRGFLGPWDGRLLAGPRPCASCFLGRGPDAPGTPLYYPAVSHLSLSG